ncbi:GNAT family N-acetyltransferase [Treponema sp. OttesenSCG-928-L16]|nr:GNAT family N-acetyltransferase [Treponema sp. OttesenSCG-928-L16]
MMFNSGCIICGADLEYLDEEAEMKCSVCNEKFRTAVKCINKHFVCDSCHRADAADYVESYCINSFETNPLKILITVMKNPNIKMHGPEHHFLVPAVLLTSYYNSIEKRELLKEKLLIAKKRSENIPGGFCGFYGNCGAGVGSGIFISIITEATPLSKEAWKLSNLMTAKSLENIANHGGPRCCKRDSFLALESAIDFLKEKLHIELPKEIMECDFSIKNKECKREECKYYNRRINRHENNHTFEKASSKDLPAIKEMAKEVIRNNYESFLGKELIEYFISSGSSDKDIEENIENCIVMKMNETIIGFGTLNQNKIHLIMIAPKYQHKSYGSKLLSHLENILFEKYPMIELRSFKDNKNTNNFYIKNKWTAAGTEKDEGIEMVLFKKDKLYSGQT